MNFTFKEPNPDHIRQLDELYKETSYQGNQNLTSVHEATIDIPPAISKTWAEEIIHCKIDPVYFANRYYYIVSTEHGKMVIKTFPKQNELLQCMIDNNRVVTLASRQTGKTTSYCIFICWLVCFSEDKRVLILANKQDTALGIMDNIRLAFEYLPKWLKPAVKYWNKGTIEFSNGCKVEACATSSSAARSKSINVLILDECAFVPPHIAEALWCSVYPILASSKNSKCIMVSTPNGTGNLFYTTYTNAEQGKMIGKERWVPFRMDWWDRPGQDEEWKNIQIASFNGDMRKFAQEFGNDFLGSACTLVSMDKLYACKKDVFANKTSSKCAYVDFKGFKARVWQTPQKDRVYVLGGDIADGTGNDFTVLTVYDVTEPTKSIDMVAMFSSNSIRPAETAFVAAMMGKMFNNCFLVIESNSIGNTTIDFLNMVYMYDNIMSYGTRKLGVHCSHKTKLMACTNFKKLFDCPQIKFNIRSEELLTELEFFEKKNTSGNNNNVTYSAKSGCHDDFVMSTVWALFILDSMVVDNFFDVEHEEIGVETYPKRLRSLDGGVSTVSMPSNITSTMKNMEKTFQDLQNGTFSSSPMMPKNTQESEIERMYNSMMVGGSNDSLMNEWYSAFKDLPTNPAPLMEIEEHIQ